MRTSSTTNASATSRGLLAKVVNGFFISMGVIGICLFVALWEYWPEPLRMFGI